MKNKFIYFRFLIPIIILFLLLYKIDSRYLWQDEAQTANISKTVIQKYYPVGFDKKNSFSQNFGNDHKENGLWSWHSYLQFYVCALSFKLFGISTFTARILFVLLSFLALISLYIFIRKKLNIKWFSDVYCFLILLNSSYFILSKQCRYYSLTMLSAVYILISIASINENRKNGFIYLFFSLLFLFHSNYFIYFCFIVSLILYFIFIAKENYKKGIIIIFSNILLNLYFIYLYGSNIKYSNVFNIMKIKKSVLLYSELFDLNILNKFSLLLILLVFIYSLVKRKNELKVEIFLLLNILITFVFSILFTEDVYFRFFSHLILYISVFIIFLIDKIPNNRIKYAIFVAVLGLNIYNSDIKKYIKEIHKNQKGPIRGICEFIDSNKNKFDTAFISYGDQSLIFYSNLKVYGGLTGEKIPRNIKPDWLIFRNNNVTDFELKLKKEINSRFQISNYDRFELKVQDQIFENSDNPKYFYYKSAIQNVIIYKRN